MYFQVCLKIQILLLEVKYIWWCISLTSVNSTSGGVCSTSSSNFTLILSPFEPALHQYCSVRIFNDFFFFYVAATWIITQWTVCGTPPSLWDIQYMIPQSGSSSVKGHSIPSSSVDPGISVFCQQGSHLSWYHGYCPCDENTAEWIPYKYYNIYSTWPVHQPGGRSYPALPRGAGRGLLKPSLPTNQ